MPINYQNKQLHPTPSPPPPKNTLKIKSCREKLNKKKFTNRPLPPAHLEK